MQNFKDLHVWQKAHDLTLSTYKATATFPTQELYSLTSQMRRSCSSIPSNIAEGCGRGGAKELGRFLQIARGSASELEYQLLLARDLGFLNAPILEVLSIQLEEVQKMLASLRDKVTYVSPAARGGTSKLTHNS
jgi:four helix bundle protein